MADMEKLRKNLEARGYATSRFETAAEIRMIRVLGAQITGMTLVPEAPLAQIGSSLTVTKNGLRSSVPLERVSQIVVSAVERERLYGRAVTGMLCFTCWQQAHAALLFSERPLVVVDYDPRGFETPALCAQMVFGEEDEVTLSGLVPEALVIADGNPYLRSFESVTLRYRPGVIQTANLVK